MPSRRALLLGTAGLAGTTGGLGLWWERRDPSYAVPSGTREQVVSGSFRSTAMSAVVGYTVVYPSSPAPLPVLVHLHGRGGHHGDVRRYGPFLYEHARRGGTPYAIVGVDGGDHTYYHRRASGQDPQRMIVSELLPVLAGRALRTERLAVGGVSMGGYGALLLAEALGPSRVRSCAVDSPAVFASASEVAGGAFDGADDFRANDVVARAGQLRGVPLRVTCGTSDPFLPGVRQLLAAVPSAERDISRGGHNEAFWLHVAADQVAFTGRHLA